MTDQSTTENAAPGGTGEAVCSASWQVELNCCLSVFILTMSGWINMGT